ncbi:MAG: TRAP transporter small permease subunit [Melioribacteraceae bacterium]|nr:TRAP transporter small permease subunit [Melioribacteraceae bacterium]
MSVVDLIINKSGKLAAALSTVLVLLVCYDVTARYILKSSDVWIQELEWHIFAFIFLVGAAYTLKDDSHVRVDLLYTKFPVKYKNLVNIAGILFFLIPFAVVIIYASRNFVYSSFTIGESSPDPGGLPARFIVKSIIPISFFLLLLQGFALLIKTFMISRKLPDKE